jgi:FKBP-type peptidyl-prolyl cis-trans isomerase SlyD
MVVDKNKVVSVQYTLYIKSDDETTEEIAEKTEDSNPFVFLFGTGGVIDDFETNLAGKKAGDAFDFRIEAKNGYGDYDDTALVELPIDAFKMQDGKIDYEMLEIGNELPMTDSDGNRLVGIVADVNDKIVVMDFNHPMAGEDLHFVGSILEVREATDEEISHGHVHGPGGHHHH